MFPSSFIRQNPQFTDCRENILEKLPDLGRTALRARPFRMENFQDLDWQTGGEQSDEG